MPDTGALNKAIIKRTASLKEANRELNLLQMSEGMLSSSTVNFSTHDIYFELRKVVVAANQEAIEAGVNSPDPLYEKLIKTFNVRSVPETEQEIASKAARRR